MPNRNNMTHTNPKSNPITSLDKPRHSAVGGSHKMPKSGTPLYCTAEPGTDEWKEYQTERLKSLRNLKAKKDFQKENEDIINQLRVVSRSKSATETTTEVEDFEIDGNQANGDPDSRERTDRNGILKKSLSTSSTSIPKSKRYRSRSNIRWKEPVVQTPPRIAAYIHPHGRRLLLASSIQKPVAINKFPKIITPTKTSSKMKNASATGRAGGMTLAVANKVKASQSRNSGTTTSADSSKTPGRNLKIKSKPKLNKLSFTVVNPKAMGSNSATNSGTSKIKRGNKGKASQESGAGPFPRRSASTSTSNKKLMKRENSSTPNPAYKKPAILGKVPTKPGSNTSDGRDLNSRQEPVTSLSDFVAKAKVDPPVFPNLQVCTVLPGTAEWYEYWENFNGEISRFNKSMDKYTRGRSEFSQQLEEYSRKLKRSTLDDLAFQALLGMRPGDKKPPILRQPLTIPLTLVGPYVIKRDVKSSILSPPTSIHLTSFDHRSFRMEIGLIPIVPRKEDGTSSSTPQTVVYQALIPNETYFVNIDCKFNMMLVRIQLPSMNADASIPLYKEEIQIAVPPDKSVFTDLQVSSSQQNNGRIIINGK